MNVLLLTQVYLEIVIRSDQLLPLLLMYYQQYASCIPLQMFLTLQF